ncbi:hypothetical protein JQ633_07325 [Bradyrhizobium tropiciagri]|uniref:hypothetical protein n=1 Tax=Bradyrhizobium tropiciagri TaxID=312253 RepID=UPI001BA9F5AC|nr:hypothetical protein [Bradyrhizobium tropiciagri]MBR0870161.1 hypothetical protein [Bradyrhizobium tropiciagri]
MRIAIWLAATTALTLATPVRAERPDCSLFPDARSRFTCYDNVSRAPPEPATSAMPAERPAAAQPQRRKPRGHHHLTPARHRSP